MLRTWIARVSRTSSLARPGSTGRRRPRAAPRFEDLEDRLSLSSTSAGGIVAPDLNPQPLPPFRSADINPQPLPPGRHIELNPQPLPPRVSSDLNPQPLPP
jgi:hypothetical protein